ncbi:MAG TPA: hypothetical protein VGS22_05490 [Thermoanaerobaculia bacterium]|jgi:hypothetical protein|nr:hypothetical protein [Thermoanaerobaculia bacterium]
MLSTPGPLRALAQCAAETPERPFLFFVRGLDWRWLSYRETAERVGGLAVRLDRLPAGARTGFPATAGLSSVLLDLAIRATDRVAVPIGPLGAEAERDPELARLGADAFLSLPGFAPSQTVPTVEIPDPFTLSAALPEGEGGVLTEESAGTRIASSADIAAAGERFERALSGSTRQSTPSARPAREIVLVGPPSRREIDRAFSDGAFRSGAACLFEPDPAARAATAAWGRVTIYAGSAAELAELKGRAQSAQKVPFSRSRLPFDRLHTVFCTDPEGLDRPAIESWRASGVEIG